MSDTSEWRTSSARCGERAGWDLTVLAGSESVRSEIRNPYKGLRAFQEADTADFFGRDELVDVVIESLERRRFVALVGPSGGGKSSLVRAGVVPRLREGASGLSASRHSHVSRLASVRGTRVRAHGRCGRPTDEPGR